MNEAGEIVCGPHGRPYCKDCSDEERKRLGIPIEEPSFVDKILAIEKEDKAQAREEGAESIRSVARFGTAKRKRGAAAIRGSQR